MSTRGRRLDQNEQIVNADDFQRHDEDSVKPATFDYKTDELKLHCKTVYEAAKAVHKFGEKVRQKQKKTKSKHLDKYKDEYTDNLNILKDEIPFIDGILNKKKRKIERTVSDAGKLNPKKCHECDNKDREIFSLKRELTRLSTQMDTHVHKDELKQEIEKLHKQNDRLRQQYTAEQEAKNEALQRLSSVASNRLRDNNPNITDLSDQNRPTKIAEKLSEVYDNEWTDAFDVLEKQNIDEIDIIDRLRKSLMDVYNECCKLANDNFFEKVQSVIECPRMALKPSPLTLGMSEQLTKEIKEFRKCQAPKVLNEIEAIVLPKIDLCKLRSKDISKYLSKCIEICWLMVVQDPPLELLEKAPDEFDANKFKDYTRRGRFTEYVVWPALLLHKNGPLLTKGVAQGCDRSFKSQSLGRSQKMRKENKVAMVGTFPARSGGKRPAIKESTFRAPDEEIVTHI